MGKGRAGLDPQNWDELRALGHRMLDDAFDYLEHARDRPVWQKMPDELRAELAQPLPHAPESPDRAYEDFRRLVLPYATGNTHPRFMGWVHGGGTPIGMLAEMLAGALNANLGGRDHAPIEVERQVIRWAAEMLGLPRESSGILVTGTSIANLIGLLVARAATLGAASRRSGIGGARLTAYASAAAHSCIPQALDIAGIGSEQLRLIRCDGNGRLDITALEAAIAEDRAAGNRPFFVVGTAGTVDIGAVDDLTRLARLCRQEGLWFHVDGAFGAMLALSEKLRPLIAGIEQADSVAFDFHKWAQVPYDAGCILVRDAVRHRAAFAQSAAYLRRDSRGLAGGHPWPCDFGPDLSRGFRALKVWLTIKVFGAERLGAVVETSCALAARLADRVAAEPELELLAPVALNIVCFRYAGGRADAGWDLDALNTAIVADLQEAGIAAPSTTTIGGRLAIRAALVNHRTEEGDIAALIESVLRIGRARSMEAA
ncbi:MAG TPA: pyridoxal-dependent decarboxylase [Acetobacteraceae bacterium]|nr:pyridoxal-dependent decarboxylase [Acetobacteraceae bacterium]